MNLIKPFIFLFFATSYFSFAQTTYEIDISSNAARPVAIRDTLWPAYGINLQSGDHIVATITASSLFDITTYVEIWHNAGATFEIIYASPGSPATITPVNEGTGVGLTKITLATSFTTSTPHEIYAHLGDGNQPNIDIVVADGVDAGGVTIRLDAGAPNFISGFNLNTQLNITIGNNVTVEGTTSQSFVKLDNLPNNTNLSVDVTATVGSNFTQNIPDVFQPIMDGTIRYGDEVDHDSTYSLTMLSDDATGGGSAMRIPYGRGVRPSAATTGDITAAPYGFTNTVVVDGMEITQASDIIGSSSHDTVSFLNGTHYTDPLNNTAGVGPIPDPIPTSDPINNVNIVANSIHMGEGDDTLTWGGAGTMLNTNSPNGYQIIGGTPGEVYDFNNGLTDPYGELDGPGMDKLIFHPMDEVQEAALIAELNRIGATLTNGVWDIPHNGSVITIPIPDANHIGAASARFIQIFYWEEIEIVSLNSCNVSSDIPVIEDASFCAGSTIDLSSLPNTDSPLPSGNFEIRFFTSNSSAGTELSGTALTQAGAGTYYAFYYDTDNMCYSDASVTVEITEDALPIANAGSDIDLAGATTGTLDGSASTPNGSISYSWAGPGIVSGGTTATPTINATGTYTLTVTNTTTGCINTDTVEVTDSGVPCNVTNETPAVADTSNSCPTTSVDLTSLANTDAFAGTVVWFDSNDPATGTQVTTATTTGTYYAFYYDSVNDCYSTTPDAVTITINTCVTCTVTNETPAVADASNSCPGASSVDLSSLTNTDAFAGTVVWFDSNDPATGTQVTTATTTGTYYAFYYDSVNDCYSTTPAAVSITVTDCTAACHPSGATSGNNLDSNVLISSLRANVSSITERNAYLVLESKEKGFVITRGNPANVSSPLEGMLMYDTVQGCLSLYDGTDWGCLIQTCQ